MPQKRRIMTMMSPLFRKLRHPRLPLFLCLLLVLSFLIASSTFFFLNEELEATLRFEHRRAIRRSHERIETSVKREWDARRARYNHLPLTLNNAMKKVAVDRRYTPEYTGPNSNRSVRLVCVTYTYKDGHSAASEVSRTWGGNCTKHLIFTNSDTPAIAVEGNTEVWNIADRLAGGFGYGNIWQRVRYIVQFLVTKGFAGGGRHDQDGAFAGSGHGKKVVEPYDFFLFGGDDVFVVLENLRKYLLSSDVWPLHSEQRLPLHLGHLLTTGPPESVAFLSGAGYLLNDVALRLLYQHRDDPACHPDEESHMEDVFTSRCLAHLGCPPRDTIDEYGEDRVTIVGPMLMVKQAQELNFSRWYHGFHTHRGAPKRGNDVVSVGAFLFHYVKGEDRDAYRRLIYRENENDDLD